MMPTGTPTRPIARRAFIPRVRCDSTDASRRRAPARAPRPLALALVLGAACAGDPPGEPPPPGARAVAFQVVAGDRQTGEPGAELPTPLRVRVVDAAGRPVAGQVVNFRVVSGGGSVFAGAALTDGEGRAADRWTLGTSAADSQRVEVRAVDAVSGDGVVYATFRATARATVPAALTRTAPDSQTAPAGTPVAAAPAVRVVDRYGNPVADVAVRFRVTAGGGTLADTLPRSDTLGVAGAGGWTLGAVAGAQAVAASVGTLPAIAFRAVATAAATPGRSLRDRPDDVSGEQVHVIYVLPADGEDRRLDVEGVLARSVGSFQTWLAAQTGGRRLRLDTHDGALDVTFARLARTDAQVRGYGAYVRDTLERDLAAAGAIVPGKVYAVYYDGGSTWACGGGAWPPALAGRVAALYLRGTPPGAPPCAANPFAATATSPPGYLEFAMLHELLHTLGFVAANAPHHARSGHVADDPTDLMYAGDAPWRPAVLDAERDDYFGANVPAGVRNLAASPLLTPAASAVAAVTVARTEPGPVLIGDTVTFGAVARDSAGRTVSAAPTWLARDPAVATVDAAGRAVARAAGHTVLVAAVDGVRDSVPLVVEPGGGTRFAPAAALDSAMLALLAERGLVGGALAVMVGGRLVHARGYGWADRDAARAVGPRTIFRMFSISKTLTAAAVLRARDEGRLRLTDSAYAIRGDAAPLPGMTEDPRMRGVRLEHLLWFSSGLLYAYPDPALDCWRGGSLGREGHLRCARGLPLAFDPGTRQEYTNDGSLILGRVLEAATRLPYDEYVRRAVLIPTGATGIRLQEARLADRPAEETRAYPTDWWAVSGTRTAIEQFDATGGWTASPAAVLRYLRGVTGGGSQPSILSASSLALLASGPPFRSAPSWLGPLFWPTREGAGYRYEGVGSGSDGGCMLYSHAPGGVSYVVAFNTTPVDCWAVNAAIRPNVLGVVRWPEHDLFATLP